MYCLYNSVLLQTDYCYYVFELYWAWCYKNYILLFPDFGKSSCETTLIINKQHQLRNRHNWIFIYLTSLHVGMATLCHDNIKYISKS